MPLWRITIRGLMLGQVHENQLHAKGFEGGQTDPQQVGFRIRDVWLPQIRTLHTNQLTYNTIIVRDLDAPTIAPTTIPVNITGSISSDSNVLPFAAMVVQFQTNQAGRKGRGRYYIGAIPTVAHAGGILTAARIAGFETMRGILEPAFLGNSATAGLKLVVHGNSGDPTGSDVVRMVARPVMGVQRRRNLGIGI